MNDGMKIILERMKTHPEEFKGSDKNPFAYSGKWIGLVNTYEHNLPEEDLKAFKEAVDTIRQEEFTARVMEELLDPKSEQLELDLKATQIRPRMPSSGQTQGLTLTASNPWVTAGVLTSNTNSLTIGSTTINESHLEHMKAHVESLQKQKPHKTLFGRLFNYT